MDDFAEDHLPSGQPLIVTSNVRRVFAFAKLICDPTLSHAGIGTVTGDAGTGKTTTFQFYVDSLAPRPDT